MKKLILAALLSSAPVIATAQDAQSAGEEQTSERGRLWTIGGQETIILPLEPIDGMRIEFFANRQGGMKVVGFIKRNGLGEWEFDGDYLWSPSVGTPCEQGARYVNGPHWGQMKLTFNADWTRFRGAYDSCKLSGSGLFKAIVGSATGRTVLMPRRSTHTRDTDQLPAPSDPATLGPGRRAPEGGRPTPPPPQQLANCDWRTFTQLINSEGRALIAEFKRDVAQMVKGDNDRVIDSKRFPYSPTDTRASFVSAEENDKIMEWEKIAQEMIANQGGDNWMVNNASSLEAGLDAMQDEYFNTAFQGERCITPNDGPGAQTRFLNKAQGAAFDRRASGFLTQELNQATILRDKYTNIIWRLMGNTGSLGEKLGRVTEDMYDRALGQSDWSEQQKRSLNAELAKAKENLARRKAQGEYISQDEIEAETKAAFERVGINYRAPQSQEELQAETNEEVFKGAVANLFGYLFKPEQIPNITRGSYVLSIIDHIQIFNATFDIGTVNTVNERGLPTTNAVREDVGQFLILINRHERYADRFVKLMNDYEDMFARAAQRAQRR